MVATKHLNFIVVSPGSITCCCSAAWLQGGKTAYIAIPIFPFF